MSDSTIELALEAVWRAGRVTLAHFQSGVAVETKEDASPVTVADREAERVMREMIQRAYPADGILGEEYGTEREGAARRWILDPIDGTRAFIHGVPLYGVLLALEEAGEILLGVAHFPALQETVWAQRGQGCFWNGRRARVSEKRQLHEALVCTSDAERMSPSQRDGWDRLRGQVEDVRTWGDAYGYALVATGRAEAMMDASFSLWDAAAVRPLIEEAGGVFTDWQGTPTHQGGSGVATNAALASSVRAALAGNAREEDR